MSTAFHIYYVARVEGKEIIRLEAGPFFRLADAEEDIAPRRWSCENYRVVQRSIAVELVP